MARGRSRSLLQQVAQDIPSYTEDKLYLGDGAVGESLDEFKLKRASRPIRSRSLPNGERNVENGGWSIDLVYPFADNDKEHLWNEYVKTYAYNELIDDENWDKLQFWQDDLYLNFEQSCRINVEIIGGLLAESESILETLSRLVTQYNKVSSETGDFAEQSMRLLKKQEKYKDISDKIHEFLDVFESLEGITKALSSPGNRLIKSQSFQNILRSLDQALKFIEEHPEFKDIETYKIRFRHCMTRALTLIKNYLVKELKYLNDVIYSKLDQHKQGKQGIIQNLTIDMLLYSEFNNYVDENQEKTYNFPTLLSQITTRIEYHDEYKGLLHDVLGLYFKTRTDLINMYIEKNKVDIGKKDVDDLSQFSQDYISFFKRIIDKELTMVFKFMEGSAPCLPDCIVNEVSTWFKSLVEPLHDILRNRIIRENNITTLCQLTTILQKYYEFEESDVTSIINQNKINWGELFEPILHDVQTRLIFRIQIYVDSKLMKYKPSPEDLQMGNRKRQSSLGEDLKVNPLDADFDENLFKEVYLPLGKALTILSNIYELINSVVFDDIAHYIVHSCIQLLQDGAYKLALKHLGPIDAKLYYLKNLILLQSHLNNFDIQYVRTETTVDFTSGINEIIQTLRKGEFFVEYNNNGGLVELAKRSVPKVINNMIDAKYEIELELNNAAHDFITECANSIGEPIRNESSNNDPLEQSMQLRDKILFELPAIYKEVRLFINDRRVAKYLMDNLCNVIASIYERFYQNLELQVLADANIRSKIQDIMEVDTLVGFMSDTLSGLYENEEDKPPEIVFNQKMLDDEEPNVSD